MSTTSAPSGPAAASTQPATPVSQPDAAPNGERAAALHHARHPAAAGRGDNVVATTFDEKEEEHEALPALPPPPPLLEDGEKTTLEVDGKAVALDHLGPMVVGRDGTISRIANWGEMTDIEKRNTLRILCKRNQLRLAALRGNEAGEA